MVFPNETGAARLHEIGFAPMVILQADEEQLNRWLTDIENYIIIGNYAQTELGHGKLFRFFLPIIVIICIVPMALLIS